MAEETRDRVSQSFLESATRPQPGACCGGGGVLSGMRLAYVLGQYPESSEAFLHREMMGLCDRGNRIVVCALRRGYASAPGTSVPGLSLKVLYRPPLLSRDAVASMCWLMVIRPARLVRLLGCLCVVLGSSPRAFVSGLRNLHAIAFFLRSLDPDDVEHVHGGFLNVPGLLAMTIAAANGLPFSVAAHARDVFVENAWLPLLVRKARFAVFCNRAAYDAAGLLAGEAVKAKFHLVHHGLDFDRWTGSANAPRDSHAEVPLLLAVGRLVEKKGFDVLIRACGLLRDQGATFRLEICGEGRERKRLQGLIDELGLQGHVALRGWCSDAGLLNAYHAATALVAPSVRANDGDQDGIPNVLLEATACGLLVIASRLAGPAEFVEDGVTGLLADPGDAAHLARTIGRALSDTELRARLAATARDRLHQAFDLKRNVARLDALFSGVHSV